mgnify:FL=1
MKLIQPGNSKLHNAYMFNLPATKEVCNRACPGCYAAREQVRFPVILEARTKRLNASKDTSFSTMIITELTSLKTKPKYFRVHASGEFYSQDYISHWELIAKEFPQITFYAYTKRMNDFDFSTLSALPNFVLINSLQFNKLNYSKLEDAPKEAFICPSSKEVLCGESCVYCMTKTAQANGVWFIKH